MVEVPCLVCGSETGAPPQRAPLIPWVTTQAVPLAQCWNRQACTSVLGAERGHVCSLGVV
jgi:hypothetical protein